MVHTKVKAATDLGQQFVHSMKLLLLNVVFYVESEDAMTAIYDELLESYVTLE